MTQIEQSMNNDRLFDNDGKHALLHPTLKHSNQVQIAQGKTRFQNWFLHPALTSAQDSLGHMQLALVVFLLQVAHLLMCMNITCRMTEMYIYTYFENGICLYDCVFVLLMQDKFKLCNLFRFIALKLASLAYLQTL